MLSFRHNIGHGTIGVQGRRLPAMLIFLFVKSFLCSFSFKETCRNSNLYRKRFSSTSTAPVLLSFCVSSLLLSSAASTFWGSSFAPHAAMEKNIISANKNDKTLFIHLSSIKIMDFADTSIYLILPAFKIKSATHSCALGALNIFIF